MNVMHARCVQYLLPFSTSSSYLYWRGSDPYHNNHIHIGIMPNLYHNHHIDTGVIPNPY